MSALFTIVFDYAGGTYISQVESRDHHDALRLWVRNLDVKEISGMDKICLKHLSDQVTEEIRDGSLVALRGIGNVWCFHGLIRGKGALAHIIKTLR